jgi:hypothetical protein
MRPAQRIKQAEEVARRLKALLSSSILSQLLQHAPPAALTAEQDAQLPRCCSVICQLETSLHEAPSLKLQLVDAVLKQQAACSIGSLFTWVQQQPEQQLSDLGAITVAGHQGSAAVTLAAGRPPASIWTACVNLLHRFAAVAVLQNTQGAGACSLAAALTQQLDQSGKACSHKVRVYYAMILLLQPVMHARLNAANRSSKGA